MAKFVMRMDDELKKGAEELFDELGMTMTTAITVFIKKEEIGKGTENTF